MIIDVSLLIKNETEEIISSEEVDGFAIYDDVKVLTPIKLRTSASLKHGLLKLDLDMAYNTQNICSRCLKEYMASQELKFKEEYTIEKLEELYPQAIIDSVQIAKELIILKAPVKNLCKEDCLGLCIICGIDKNEHICDCDETKSNPYFDKLKILLSKQDKEV
jgi:uncharacterized protein